jgi:hypothetical protein
MKKTILLCVFLFYFSNPEKPKPIGLSLAPIVSFKHTRRVYEPIDSIYSKIKFYESLTTRYGNCGNYIGYGHYVYDYDSNLLHTEITSRIADSILRTDFSKNYSYFRSYGNDSIPLSLLAYACGAYSNIIKEITQAMKDNKPRAVIDSLWLSISVFNGKPHKTMLERRKWELNMLKYEEK